MMNDHQAMAIALAGMGSNDPWPQMQQIRQAQAQGQPFNFQIQGGGANKPKEALVTVEPLLSEDNALLNLASAYERHGLPVPEELTKKRNALAVQIKLAWRSDLEAKIAAEEKKVEELRSNEEKQQKAEAELARLRARLKALRDGK